MGGTLDYSTTAESNTTVGGVSIAEGMQAGLVNNGMRAMMADSRKWQLDWSGIVTAGAGNAYTITSNQGIAAYADGLRFSFKADRNNTGAATLNVDSRGAKALRKVAGGALAAVAANDIVAEVAYDVVYDLSSDVFVIVGWTPLPTISAFAETLLDDADAAAMRTTLVLGAMATKADVTTAEIAAATLVTAAETIRSNNNNTTLPTSAAVAQEAIGLFYVLNSTTAGANVNTVQDFFPQDVTPEGSTQYVYELVVAMVKTAGGTSHAIETSFAGTATLNYILRNFYASAITAGATVAAPLTTNGYKTSAAAENMTGSFAGATTSFWMRDTGIISVNASGTLIPQYRLTAAPGGAYSVVAGSYFRLRKLGASGADIAIGPWA